MVLLLLVSGGLRLKIIVARGWITLSDRKVLVSKCHAYMGQNEPYLLSVLAN